MYRKVKKKNLFYVAEIVYTWRCNWGCAYEDGPKHALNDLLKYAQEGTMKFESKEIIVNILTDHPLLIVLTFQRYKPLTEEPWA